MRIAEHVTFGGGGLERAAELRGQTEALALLAAKPEAKLLPMWRGKPQVSGAPEAMRLAPVAPGDPILAEATEDLIFLGRSEGCPWFAADISAWAPPELDETALNQFLDPTEQHYPGQPETARFAELRAIMTRLTPADAEIAATARAILSWHGIHGFCARCGGKSEITMAGWQRDCPACGGKHFPRTDPVVIMLITHGNSVLVGRSPGWPEGMYSLLAGFVEPGETIEAAVRREVFEEAGVPVGPVSYLASQPWPFPASLMIGCAGEALSRDITIDPVEIEDALWVTREEMLGVFAGTHPEINPARKGAIAHFLLQAWLADQLD